MHSADWPAVRSIYEQGIATGQATFAAAAPENWGQWDSSHLMVGRLVARRPAGVVGWTALSAVSSRCVYAGVAELSVYVSAETRGTGVGRLLLAALIAATEQAGIWTLQAGIFPENFPSLALHRQMGFRDIGRRERVGKMTFGPQAGRWRDVLFLERRSIVAGID